VLLFGGYFSCISITHPSTASPSFPYSSSHFTPPFPFPKEVQKLSYRRQNALIVIRTHESNTSANILLFSGIHQSRLTRGIMFSICLFIRPSVCPFGCSFVRCELVNAMFSKGMNRFQYQLRLGHERSTSGLSKLKGEITEGQS